MTLSLKSSTARPPGWTDAEWERLVDSLTRRRFLGGAAAMALLAACGGRQDAMPEVMTRVVDSVYGQVTLPVAPKRIIAVDPYSLFTLLDAGITPIATTSSEAFAAIGPDTYKTTVSALPTVGNFGAIDVEEIVSLKPDLVIGLST